MGALARLALPRSARIAGAKTWLIEMSPRSQTEFVAENSSVACSAATKSNSGANHSRQAWSWSRGCNSCVAKLTGVTAYPGIIFQPFKVEMRRNLVVVAEELHFGRAACRLSMSQPAVVGEHSATGEGGRRIRVRPGQQERRLTDAGVFLPSAMAAAI